MSVQHRNGSWIVRWRGGGRMHSKTFYREQDAIAFDAKVKRRKQIGSASRRLHLFDRNQAGAEVYVLQGGDKVKIGISVDPIGRAAARQTASPVRLSILWRITCPDARHLEAALHARYAAHRLHGEWFEAQPVLADLSELAKLGPFGLQVTLTESAMSAETEAAA